MKSPKQEVFVYASACCGARAEKPALVKVRPTPKSKGKGKGKSYEAVPVGLGHWSCTQCGKGCKVSRSKPAKEEANAGN